jgi:hypothetical protein
MMEIKEIVISDKLLPIDCSHCSLMEMRAGKIDGWCPILCVEVYPYMIGRHNSCPLVLEDGNKSMFDFSQKEGE